MRRAAGVNLGPHVGAFKAPGGLGRERGWSIAPAWRPPPPSLPLPPPSTPHPEARSAPRRGLPSRLPSRDADAACGEDQARGFPLATEQPDGPKLFSTCD